MKSNALDLMPKLGCFLLLTAFHHVLVGDAAEPIRDTDTGLPVRLLLFTHGGTSHFSH